jgi:hypothetical protein
LHQGDDLIGKGKRQVIAHARVQQYPSQEAGHNDTSQT